MKKNFKWFIPLILLGLLVVGCSKKTKNPINQSDGKIINYEQLQSQDRKKVIFELDLREVEDHLEVDTNIKNQSSKNIKIDLSKLYLSDKKSSVDPKESVKLKPGENSKIRKVFLVEKPNIRTLELKLRIENLPIYGVIVRGFEKLDGVSVDDESKEINSSDNITTQVDTKDLNNLTWISGSPDILIGNYLSDPTGQDTSMEKNYKVKLLITKDQFKIIPEAQMDGFFLDQIEYVKIDNHTYVLHGITLGNSFYEKINIKKNGDITINESHGTEEGFGKESFIYHKIS